jgi:hypothetical protein
MRLTDKTGAWDRLKRWEGKYKKFEVSINQGSSDPHRGIVDYYYFVVICNEPDLRHNSLWTKDKYSSKEEAEQAAINWIDEKLKAIK